MHKLHSPVSVCDAMCVFLCLCGCFTSLKTAFCAVVRSMHVAYGRSSFECVSVKVCICEKNVCS